jgi:hypothetical protein
MALLDEEIVEYWLNNNGFFCMRGVKTGLGEIDFLAIRPNSNGFECWQVEVTVSFRPIGYIGGNTNAKKRNTAEVEQGIDDWLNKKFTNEHKVQKRNERLPNADWNFVLVCAEVRAVEELDLLEQKGVKILRYRDLLDELASAKTQVNSTAGNIVEILRYANKA